MKATKQVILPKGVLKFFPKHTNPEILRKGHFTILKPNFTEATAGMIKGSKIGAKEALEDYEDYLIERGLGK